MARAMKDSGIEWIGEIPEGWKVSKVSTFFDIQLGKMLQPSQENESDTYESYLCAANLGNNKLKMEPLKQMWFSREDKEKFSVRCGDLLVVEGGDVASSDIIAEPVHGLYIQNALHRVRSRNGFELRFLRYYLSIAKASGHIDLICNKATIAHFTKDKFGALPYVVVPLEEQKRIADYLDSECARIDAVIEQTRASIEEYKKLKQAVITQAVTKGIRPGRKMKDSGNAEIGSIPDEWIEVKNSFLFRENVRVPREDSVPLSLSQADGLICTDDMKESSLKTSTYEGWKRVEIGDLVLNRFKAHLGVFFAATIVGMVSFHYGVYEPVTKLNSKFFEYLYHSDIYRGIYAHKSNGMTVGLQNLSNQNFYSVKSLVPPLEEQNEIVEYLDLKISEIDALVLQKEQIIAELESYKKSLIFEYVTGKKEVR